MSNQCNTQGCGSGKSYGGSCGCGSTCGCGCDKCKCGSTNSCCSKKEDECHFAKDLLCIADSAWMEVLTCKIKERILAINGQSLDELAKIVVDTNSERWKTKMIKQKNCQDYEEKIEQFFHKKQ